VLLKEISEKKRTKSRQKSEKKRTKVYSASSNFQTQNAVFTGTGANDVAPSPRPFLSIITGPGKISKIRNPVPIFAHCHIRKPWKEIVATVAKIKKR